MTALLQAEGVTRLLTDPLPVTLVRDVTLTVQPGEFVAVVGPSGCGKSSLLYLLGLLDRPTRGEVSIDGQATSGMSENDRSRIRLERIGFVFQFHFLLPELTARENIALPIRRRGGPNAARAGERAAELLGKLGLAEQADRRPNQMSGGQRQRVAIARALANNPSIILGDEPTGNLDSTNTTIVVDEFRRLAREEGRAVICVTHDMNVAAAADRQIHMLDGRIERDGKSL